MLAVFLASFPTILHRFVDALTGVPMPPVERAGFLIPIILAIVSIITTVVQFVAEVGQLVFHSIEEVARFAARGVGWLTGVLRKGFGELIDGLGSAFQSIGRWLGNLYCDYEAFKSKLLDWFGPVVDFLKKVKEWYDRIWKQWVQPVLNIMQRIRKILAIFKLFHLKWAEKLDSDIALIEGKIASNFLVFRNYLNLAISWSQFVVDPLGALRRFPLFAGILNNLNLFWAGIFGAPFNYGGEGLGGGATAHVSVTLGQTTAEVQAGAWDDSVVQLYTPQVRSDLFSELGVSG